VTEVNVAKNMIMTKTQKATLWLYYGMHICFGFMRKLSWTLEHIFWNLLKLTHFFKIKLNTQFSMWEGIHHFAWLGYICLLCWNIQVDTFIQMLFFYISLINLHSVKSGLSVYALSHSLFVAVTSYWKTVSKSKNWKRSKQFCHYLLCWDAW